MFPMGMEYTAAASNYGASLGYTPLGKREDGGEVLETFFSKFEILGFDFGSVMLWLRRC